MSDEVLGDVRMQERAQDQTERRPERVAAPFVDLSGPAFPGDPFAPGLTKREWFAGQALAGVLADPNFGPDGIETLCFEIADAMIAESRRAR